MDSGLAAERDDKSRNSGCLLHFDARAVQTPMNAAWVKGTLLSAASREICYAAGGMICRNLRRGKGRAGFLGICFGGSHSVLERT